ncbi:hypothetical protein [Pseudalkalibacillus caeni]|uniref:hypothetical protein n=1 Tax=Exobacillus caeni TaxID=2574798 RepID=UPI0014854678|nr:hypothetical protein [Pseudalkalibacillus caeni]
MNFLLYFLIFFGAYVIITWIVDRVKKTRFDKVKLITGAVLALIYSVVITLVKG